MDADVHVRAVGSVVDAVTAGAVAGSDKVKFQTSRILRKGDAMKKYEKITLYTATETYDERGMSALDYLIPELDGVAAELTILDYDSEDYKLVKVKKVGNA